jgi:hypothetical protein
VATGRSLFSPRGLASGGALLGAAGKDARVAAFQPDDALAGASGGHDDAVDAVLRPGGSAGRLADIRALGVAAGELEGRGIDRRS